MAVGFSRKRVGHDGRPRYTAYYLDAQGRERSAGTFATRRDADRSWQQVGPRTPPVGPPTHAEAA